jgi:hypothetical protein
VGDGDCGGGAVEGAGGVRRGRDTCEDKCYQASPGRAKRHSGGRGIIVRLCGLLLPMPPLTEDAAYGLSIAQMKLCVEASRFSRIGRRGTF